MRRKHRIFLDAGALSAADVRRLKALLFQQYARSTLGPDTDPDVEFTDLSISAVVIDGRKGK